MIRTINETHYNKSIEPITKPTKAYTEWLAQVKESRRRVKDEVRSMKDEKIHNSSFNPHNCLSEGKRS